MLHRLMGVAAAAALTGLGACVPATTTLNDPSAAPDGGTVRVAVIADIPYNDDQKFGLRLISDAVAASDMPFAIHLGDYKAGRGPCTAKVDAEFLAWREGLAPVPVFYTPGDNDWTDCDRDSTGAPVSELTRLETVRRLMFGKTVSLAGVQGTMGPMVQDDFPENLIWAVGDVVFATMHVVGTNNGRAQILLDDRKTALDEVAAREAAAAGWLDRAFDLAQDRGAGAVVLFHHADPTVAMDKPACSSEVPTDCDGYAGLRDRMAARAGAFGKPVLLVHGDTAPYCLDRGFGGETAPALWRLNAGGDYILIDGVDLTIAPSDRAAPFRVQSFVHRIPPASGC